ncbi:MAG: hypothetical protein JW934_06055 [Anaerolineae bacterium]|nr:hypothetical protein [Anaerolineae bacterium]
MRRLWIIATLVLIFVLVGCNKPAAVEGFTDLAKKIKADPEGYNGQTVTLIGYFRAQDLLDEVKPGFPPTNDRINDWVIKDNSAAIYVAASRLLPFPISSQDIWRKVKVTGTVALFDARSSGFMPYIVPQSIETAGRAYDYDLLSNGVIVAIHRFGGPEKLDHHIYLYDNRKLVVFDNVTGWKASLQLKEFEMREWDKTFTKLDFFNLSPIVGETCRGCIQYHIVALDTKRQAPYDVILYEGSVPANLEAYIKQVIEKTGQAQAIQ